MDRKFIYEDELPEGYSISEIVTRQGSKTVNKNGEITHEEWNDPVHTRKLNFYDDQYDDYVSAAPSSLKDALELLGAIVEYLDKGLPLPNKLAEYLSKAFKKTREIGFDELSRNLGEADEKVTNTTAVTLAAGLYIKALSKRPSYAYNLFAADYEDCIEELCEAEWNAIPHELAELADSEKTVSKNDLMHYEERFEAYCQAKENNKKKALRMTAAEYGISTKTAKRYLATNEKSIRESLNETYLGRVFSQIEKA